MAIKSVEQDFDYVIIDSPPSLSLLTVNGMIAADYLLLPVQTEFYALEGVAQLFTLELNGRKIIGTVGALQYEVIQYRLEHEYGAKCTYEPLSIHKACWIEADEKSEEFKEFARLKQRFLARDKYDQLVFLADSSFTIHMTQEKFPNVKLHFISEFKNH